MKIRRMALLLLVIVLFAVSGCASSPPAATPIAPAEQEQPATPDPTGTAAPPTDTPEPPPTDTPQPQPTDTSTPEPQPTNTPEPEPTAVFELSTTAFEAEGSIQGKYTCFGGNVSPELTWTGVPAEAKSLVLLLHDPDAGTDLGASTEKGFAHWIVYNIPSATTGYPEDVPGGKTLEDGAMQGSNDFGQFLSPGDALQQSVAKVVGYDGPCPPAKHRYVFALYALDTTLDLSPGATLADVLAAMKDHVIAQTELAGVFAPPK